MSSISIRPVESRDLARITAIYDDAVRNGAASYELEATNPDAEVYD